MLAFFSLAEVSPPVGSSPFYGELCTFPALALKFWLVVLPVTYTKCSRCWLE